MPNSESTSSNPAGPGQRLRQARLEQRRTPEDVAKELRLSPKQIVALEDDDYASLPGATYIRGYLRSYAQLLSLPADDVIAAYNRAAAPVRRPAEPAVAVAQPPPQLTSSDHKVKLGSWIVALVVVGFAFAWWFGRPPERQPQIPPPASVSPSPSESTPAVGGERVEPGGVAATPGAVPPPATTATGETPKPKAPTAATTAQPVVPAMPAKPPAPTAAGEPPKPMTPAAATTPQPTPPVTPVKPPAATPAQPARARLVLQMQADSWADVSDANSRLLYETVPAGRTVTLEGVAPFQVFLGNAEGVRVDFNGRVFDSSPYRRGPTARFTLGTEGR
ncbi:MAG: helix-turn-helix domain-containing protein [Pseudomonadota bacterium]|nr:MAG: helix-turn-helix domain-containing protein [Pseudomonadota bacterium]